MGRFDRLVDIAVGGGVAMCGWVFADTRSPAVAVVAVLAGASGLMWRRPVVAFPLALTALLVARGPAGLASSDSWNVAMAFVVAGSLGAFAPTVLAGAGVVLLSASIAWSSEANLLDLLWVGVNLGGVALLSALAARACRRSHREAARVGQLARSSPQDEARRAVAGERLRLANDVHQVIRSSVLTMRDQSAVAASAGPEQAKASLRAVQREGAQAIAELRRMLGLLRDPSADEPAPPGSTTAHRWWPWWSTALAESAGMILLALLEPVLWGAVAPEDALPPVVGFWAVTLTVIAAGSVGARRLAPSASAAVFGAVLLAAGLAGIGIGVGLWTVWAIGLLAWAAAYRRTIAGVAGLSVMLAGATALLVIRPETEPTIIIVIVIGVAGLAVMTSRHRSLAGSAQEMADRLTAERSQASEEAVHAERLLVARELHDVVSHAVVVMVVQAGAAEALLATDPPAAEQALTVIDHTAASTLAELDRLLDAINPGSTAPVNTPRRVADLRDLAARMRVGGLNVQLLCAADDAAPVDPVVYRIVQETLTNALRHAPSAHVTAEVCTDQGSTTVEVVDDGPGPGPETRRGYGLTGMTERVQHVGGVVEIGQPINGCGFRVFARLPIRPAVLS